MNQEFLDRVWPDNEGTTYIPYMLNGTWYEQSWDIQVDIPEGADIYFSVLSFNGARRKENALPGNWLWADLDEVNPYEIDLQPTIAWQSSPGRYQALWELREGVSPETLERTNQLLTYKVGADKGGWSVTKVLRIPGTKNYKYEDIPDVKLLWDDGPTYNTLTIWEYVGYIDEPQWLNELQANIPPADTYDKESVIKKAYALLDPRGRRLLMAKEAWGDRSQRLWELENRLLETGMAKEDVYITVYHTVWNKFIGRTGGNEILWNEVLKAANSSESPLESPEEEEETIYKKSKPQLVTYGDLLGSVIDEPQWLIEDWWTMGSHGIVAGLPKSYKSLVTTDMALSIATGQPFMNKFEVNEKGVGPTLIVQVENTPALLKDRIVKMANNKGLLKGATDINDGTLSVTFPADVPMFFYNDFSFDMTMSDCRTAIETIIAREGIRLVVFDPLYLMMGAVDENSSHEIRPILSWLLGLRNKYDVAIMVVHHWGKGSSDKKGRKSGGIKLLGSTTIYGWLESALYLEANPNEDGSSTVVVEREFRERLAPPPQAFRLKMGDIGEIEYGWDAEGVVGTEAKVFSLLATKPMSMTELKVASEMGEKKLRQLMTKLLANGSVTMEQDGKSKIFRLKND